MSCCDLRLGKDAEKHTGKKQRQMRNWKEKKALVGLDDCIVVGSSSRPGSCLWPWCATGICLRLPSVFQRILFYLSEHYGFLWHLLHFDLKL